MALTRDFKVTIQERVLTDPEFRVGTLMDKKPQSLMRMLSDNGNPRLSNISELVSSLRKNEGIELRVSAL